MAGLYIHIPFCASKCAYCDFYSMQPKTPDGLSRYVDALIAEWNSRRNEIEEPVETIYLGGGTPSIMPVAEIARLFEAIGPRQCCEITLEANPEHVTAGYIDSLLTSTPVNRISMGVQSFNDLELKAVGRRHTATEAERAANILSAAGPRLRSRSIDLIFGLPGQTMASWECNLSKAIALRPEHMSVYMLSYEEGTRLNAMRLAGKVKPSDDTLLCEMYEAACTLLANAGWQHYEISNYALDGHRAVHNSNYWLDRPYIGLGAGAHSFDGNARRYNPSKLADYLLHDFSEPFFTLEVETPSERLNDYIMVRLRTLEGIDRIDFEKRFGHEELLLLEKRMRPYVLSGQIKASDENIALTERSWLVSDGIIAGLFA